MHKTIETTNSRIPGVLRRRSLSRRTFLRGAGVALALPSLDAMTPALTRAETILANKPRRVFAICNNLGFIPENFFPTDKGSAYVPSPYLKVLDAHRDDFTVLSGVWHPDVDGGHPADNCFLTAAPHPARGGFRNTISLDQYLAERVGHLTRVPSLNLGVNVHQGLRSLSWTSSGVLIPCEESASAVFARMFIQGTQEETEAQLRKLKMGQSILDTVMGQAQRLDANLTARDRIRMDQYTTSIRGLEQRMKKSMEWERKPKPTIDAKQPADVSSKNKFMEKTELLYDMTRLAFETDSTRIVALLLDAVNTPAVEMQAVPITQGYHNLSHHGNDPEKKGQLAELDKHHMVLLDRLFSQLKAVKEDDEPLLDRTMIVYGSNLGDAGKHVTTNLPIIFAGGGFKHGRHLAFDNENNYPLPNLFVSMLQRLGLEEDKFGTTSTGTFSGLEMRQA